MEGIVEVTNNIALYCFKNNLNFSIENNIEDNNDRENEIKKIESNVILSINKMNDKNLLNMLTNFLKELNQ